MLIAVGVYVYNTLRCSCICTVAYTCILLMGMCNSVVYIVHSTCTVCVCMFYIVSFRTLQEHIAQRSKLGFQSSPLRLISSSCGQSPPQPGPDVHTQS